MKPFATHPGIHHPTQIAMTPFSHPAFSHRADDTRELLSTIANDTRSQLRRWTALSVFLRCPLVLTPKSRKETAVLVNHAVTILRGMLACSKEANRCFRKRRYDRCMRSLDHFERLLKALENIDRLAALTVLSSLTEGRQYGNCR